MNKTYYDINKEYKDDFETYLTFVNIRSTQYCINTNSFKGELKSIYKQVFCLTTFLKKTIPSSEKHLKESILNLPIVLDLLATNNIASFRLMCRNVIEQFNRYLFSKLTDGKTDTIRNMHTYIKEYFKKFKVNKYIKNLTDEYKHLCDYVHVTKDTHFLEQNGLSDYYFNNSQLKKITNSIKLFNRILQSMLIILVTLETQSYLSLNRDDQKLIELSIQEKIDDFVILDNYYISINPTSN
ncbi:hypothetical protein H7992_14560 [Sporosarcina sp. resist]|uniref:hypothetical protein n=1 Tax=Sporosarcina sp. resist TaxID=2762563 RepID=UPI00164E6D0D|nr:hypothetical protein [Sporosarcina sp. resist]QNK86480.1 hypothetical protein H7992_14560 [Sporosarcina sp. resist]